MKLRAKILEKPKQTKPEKKKKSVKVDDRKNHVPNQDALISLPVAKVVEKKAQKGELNFREKKEAKCVVVIEMSMFILETVTDEWQRVGRRTKPGSKKTASSQQCYMVLARGFQWKVTKQDVINFFKGIKIVGGEKGINIIKNVAMEAYVELASKADVKAALKHDSKRVDERMIHGKCDRIT